MPQLGARRRRPRPPRRAGSYCAEVEADAGVAAAGRDVRATLAATQERADAFRAQFLGYAHLWTSEMQAYLKARPRPARARRYG